MCHQPPELPCRPFSLQDIIVLPEKVKTKGRPEATIVLAVEVENDVLQNGTSLWAICVLGWFNRNLLYEDKTSKKKNMTFFVLVISCARDRFKIFILYERFVRVLGRCFSVFHFPFDCAMYPSCCRMRCGAASLFDVSVTKKRKQCEKHERQRGRKRNWRKRRHLSVNGSKKLRGFLGIQQQRSMIILNNLLVVYYTF